MRNHKFRLSDMIPNAWFYKLRDMNKTRTSKKKKNSCLNSQSKQPYTNYQTLESPKSFRVVSSDIDDIFPHLPLSRKPSPRRRIATTFDQSSCSESDKRESDFLKGSTSPCSSGFSCSDADIIIDVKESCFVTTDDKLDAFDTIPVLLDLPPIFTKKKKVNHVPDEKDTFFSMISPQLVEIDILDPIEKQKRQVQAMVKKTSPSKRAPAAAGGGIKLRTNSPRISSTKKTQGPRRSVSRSKKRLNRLSESFAVVKASVDPEKDFMESMMEMILENNIRGSKDLEHLLACYLTLNSNQYHQLIVKAFEQIWFNVPHLHS